MTTESKKDEGQLKVRLPLPLKQQIQTLAGRNRRTVTMEIVSRLERSVVDEPAAQGGAQ